MVDDDERDPNSMLRAKSNCVLDGTFAVGFDGRARVKVQRQAEQSA